MSQLYNQKSGKSVMENAKFRIKEEKSRSFNTKKKVLQLLALLFVIAFSSACGKTSDNSNAEVITERDANEKEEVSIDESVTENVNEGDYAQNSQFERILCPFSNGYAWIWFSDEKAKNVTGIIDKNGNLLYYSDSITIDLINETGAPLIPFNDEGVSYIYGTSGSVSSCFKVKKGALKNTDWQGQIAGTNVPKCSVLIGSGTDGDYICLQSVNGGIEKKTIDYDFYDCHEEKLGTVSLDYTDIDEVPLVHYMGKGRYYIYGQDDYKFDGIRGWNEPKDLLGLYFSKSNKWIGVTSYEDFKNRDYDWSCYYSDEYVLIVKSPKSSNSSILETTFCIYDEYGHEKDISFKPDEDNLKLDSIGLSDNNVFFSTYKDNPSYQAPIFYSYDINTESLQKVELEYQDRMSRFGGTLGNSFLAEEIQGADGKVYIGLYDIKSFELKCEPIEVERSLSPLSRCFILNNYLFVPTTKDGDAQCIILDENGNLIHTLQYNPFVYYSDGVYTCFSDFYDANNAEFYNEKWELLFTSDEINYSNAKHLDMQ